MMRASAVKTALRRVKTPRVFEGISEQIRKRIADGTLVPGDRLPAERQLAEEFQVSRQAVREAFRALESSGLITLTKGVQGGAVIRDPSSSEGVAKSIRDSLLGRPSSAHDLIEARDLICGVIVRLACERASDQNLVEIRQTLDAMDSVEDAAERVELGTRFFAQIAEVTGNTVLVTLVKSFGTLVGELVLQTGSKVYTDVVPHRRAILAALVDRDPDKAADASRAYFALIRSHFAT